MKRLAAFALFVMLTFCLTACAVPGSGENAERENNLDCAFESDVELVLEKLNAEGKMIHTDEGTWSVEFSSPNTLSGIKLEFAEDTVNASYKGLSFSVPQSVLPVKAMMLNLIEAVEENSAAEKLQGEEKDGLFQINGTLESGEYTLTADESGNFSAFEMPSFKFMIRKI